MDVEIKVQGGGTFSVEVGLADTVLEIKEKIEIQRGIPVSKQTLTFNNVVLQDESDVYSELAQEASLTLVIAPEPAREFAVPSAPVKGGTPSGSNKINIKVVTQHGARINMDMSPFNIVEELREKLEKAENFPLPEDGYFFIHNQQVMDEDKTFRWHMVNNGDTIEVFPGYITSGEENKRRF
ncbi:hypothetical protein LguiA_015106 [Lonicera macranthoides]